MILEELQQASFRDFAFLTPRSQIQEGRKTVTHEFVNSNDRFIEDLGRFPQKFSMTAVIHGKTSIQDRDNFRALLNKPGSGILIHPTYGRQTATVEGQYTVSENNTGLGEFIFEITFAIDSGAAFPRQGAPTTSNVAASEINARTSTLQRIEDQWNVPATTVSNSDASEKLIKYATDIANDFSPVVEDASEIIRTTDSIKLDAPSIVRSGVNVAQSISGILDSLDAIPLETLSTLGAIKGFLNFGADDPAIINPVGLSADQSNRQLNRDLFNSGVQSTSLIKAYTTSTFVDFKITPRLEANRSELAISARRIISGIRSAGVNFDAASAAGIQVNTSRDRDAVNAILDTRSVAEKILSVNEENTYRVSSVSVSETSARLLSYSLFESDDQVDIIKDLNAGQKPSSLAGDLLAINR